MDDICSPQWRDFTQDLNLSSEDYFDKPHAIHEPRFSHKAYNDITLTPIPLKHKRHLDNVDNNADLGVCPMTPIQGFSPTSTFNDVLQESIKNLQISEKRTCKTPKSNFDILLNAKEDNVICPENNIKECENVEKATTSEQSKSDDKNPQSKHSSVRKSNSKILAYKNRRNSFTKLRANKYVSLAEAVSKYQNDTPKRFHSIATKVNQQGSTTKMNQTVSSMSKVKSNTNLHDLNKTKHCSTNNLVACKGTPNSHLKKSNTKNTVPYIVPNDEGEQVALRKEILYYGVPLITKKKLTTTLNFGSSTKQTPKDNVKFASPLSENSKNNKKTPEIGSNLKNRFTLGNKTLDSKHIGPKRSLDFEGRNNQLMKKREENMKKRLEEQNTYVFRARPVPNFKPVLVRGISTENLSLRTKTPGRVSRCITKSSNEENIDRNILIDKSQAVMDKGKENVIKPVSLNSETRAMKRRLFDGQMKQKEMEIWLKHQQEEKARMESVKEETLEMRKKMGIMAKPMPVYKDPKPLRNIKPLTYPQSPAWNSKVIPKKL